MLSMLNVFSAVSRNYMCLCMCFPGEKRSASSCPSLCGFCFDFLCLLALFIWENDV